MQPETKPRSVFTNRNYVLTFFGTLVFDLGLANSACAATIKTKKKTT